MQKHTAIYLKEMGYDVSDTILCEICLKVAQDCHHIVRRGAGGTKKPDTIENLMALCRSCHESKGDKKQFMQELKEIHALRMKERGLTLT